MRPGPLAARAAGRLLTCALALGMAAGATRPSGQGAGAERAQKPLVDPVGEYVPIKPKVFKDLTHLEITDYDRARATNTREPRALVHMKKGPSALEPLEFRLSGLWLDFAARDSKGVVYRFRGRFTRAGDLYAQQEGSESVLRGHLASYLGEELLRQEHLQFRFRTGE